LPISYEKFARRNFTKQMKPIIKVENLSKRYRIGKGTAHGSIRDAVSGVIRSPLSLIRRNGKSEDNTFWAIRDVSFEVMPGDVVGIVGRNGAGKSTLLKILSRITEPTLGQIDFYGRVGSLLEVGTGFHPELTGRENIYLNGAILGMKRSEIERKFDEIVDFSEIEKFIDTPVKHFSSGMYVRLAFAVAAHLDPEILIVDEVLAVGDFAFQKKCLDRMHEFGREGRTVIFVTHDMSVLSKLCQKGILLREGRLVAEGEMKSVIKSYMNSGVASCQEWERVSTDLGERGLTIRKIKVLSRENALTDVFQSNESCVIEVTYQVNGRDVCGRISLEIETAEGDIVLTTTDCDGNGGADMLREPGAHTCRCILPPHLLAPGTYFITAAASRTDRLEWDRVSRALMFQISEIGSLYLVDARSGVIAPILNWERLS
jgi:lipopolysaccharide transport system ATP-binding protein